MDADSTFVIREEFLEGDDEREKSARMVGNAPESIGSGVLFRWGMIILLEYLGNNKL